MSELRAALENALGPMYRVEREVRPVGNCRLFVAVGPLTDPELLVKVLPGELSLAMDARVFERELVLLADRLGHAQLGAPRGAGWAGSIVYHTSHPNGATVARPPGRVTTFSRSACCCTRCSQASPPRCKRSRSRKCARYRRGWRSWHAAVSHRSPPNGGLTPPRRWSRSAGRTRKRCETRSGALLSSHRRAARAGHHARGPDGVCTPDGGAGACGLEDAHAGSVRRPGTCRGECCR